MDTLGLVESRSIAVGVALSDGMVKVADVELVKASTICSGRYLIAVAGDREAVETSVRHAEQSGRELVGSFVISHVSPLVTQVMKKDAPAAAGDAIGVVESKTVSSNIMAADKAVKRSAVRLLRLVMGRGINGKSYFVLGGDVASVQEAVKEAENALGRQLIEAVVIPAPDAAVIRALTGGVR